MEYGVVVWLDDLSDGSRRYAAVCPAISYAHDQGDTEAEAWVGAATCTPTRPGMGNCWTDQNHAR